MKVYIQQQQVVSANYLGLVSWILLFHFVQLRSSIWRAFVFVIGAFTSRLRAYLYHLNRFSLSLSIIDVIPFLVWINSFFDWSFLITFDVHLNIHMSITLILWACYFLTSWYFDLCITGLATVLWMYFSI